MVLFEMSRKEKGKRQAGPVSGCPKFVLRAVETPYPIVNPIQSRMRQLKKGAGKEEPLVRMEAGRSWSLQLVTGNQFAAGSRLLTKQAILLSNQHTKINVHNFNSAFIRGSL